MDSENSVQMTCVDSATLKMRLIFCAKMMVTSFGQKEIWRAWQMNCWARFRHPRPSPCSNASLTPAQNRAP